MLPLIGCIWEALVQKHEGAGLPARVMLKYFKKGGERHARYSIDEN